MRFLEFGISIYFPIIFTSLKLSWKLETSDTVPNKDNQEATWAGTQRSFPLSPKWSVCCHAVSPATLQWQEMLLSFLSCVLVMKYRESSASFALRNSKKQRDVNPGRCHFGDSFWMPPLVFYSLLLPSSNKPSLIQRFVRGIKQSCRFLKTKWKGKVHLFILRSRSEYR